MRSARLLTMLATLLCASSALAEPTREDQFKAAYLYNFVKFVDWPPSTANDVLSLCFIGGDGILESLAPGIDAKRAGNRRIALRKVAPGGSIEGCNVLYLDAQAHDNASISTARSLAILTVSDASAFTRRGGVIELFTDQNRLRFTINVSSANRAGLRISSNLLQLAAHVEREAQP